MCNISLIIIIIIRVVILIRQALVNNTHIDLLIILKYYIKLFNSQLGEYHHSNNNKDMFDLAILLAKLIIFK
jgi:hypothetical protein